MLHLECKTSPSASSSTTKKIHRYTQASVSNRTGPTKVTTTNGRYLAISGILLEVGGRILETSSRKTMRARRIEMHMVIFSPASDGR